MITIDSIEYDIPVISLRRSADILDKSAFRSEDGILHRELIGVYFNYKLQFGRTDNTTEYAALWAKLTEAAEYHTVVVPDLDAAPYTFTAYFSNISDELRKDKTAKTFWKNLTVDFIAMEPAIVP